MKNRLGILAFVLALLIANIFVFQSILAGSSGTITLTVEVSNEDKAEVEESNLIKLKETSKANLSLREILNLEEIADFRGSLTASEVADEIGIASDIVKRDIRDIRPEVFDDKMPTFPLIVISGKGVTEDGKNFRFYIGKIKKVELVNKNFEKTTIEYRGRLKFDDRTDTYLIMDGNEIETIFKLVPITNGQIFKDETEVAKMLVSFKEKTGSFSNLFGFPEVIDFKITELSRNTLRPEPIVTQEVASVKSITEQKSISEKEITSDEEKVKSGSTAEIQSKIKYEKLKRFSLIDWFKRLFRKWPETLTQLWMQLMLLQTSIAERNELILVIDHN